MKHEHEKYLRRLWQGIKKRCDPRFAHLYKRYAGRGIRVEWGNFDEFFADMYSSFIDHVKVFGLKDTTIERLDTDGHYTLSNCRWATWSEQFNNRKTTHKLTFQGETLSVAQWARKLGVNRSLINTRINRAGWSIEKTLTTPRQNHGAHCIKTFTVISPDGAEHTGTNLSAFCKRHSLLPEAFNNIKRGKSKTHKGWRLKQ